MLRSGKEDGPKSGLVGNWAPGGRKHWIFCDLSARNRSKTKGNTCIQAEIVLNFPAAPNKPPNRAIWDGTFTNCFFRKEALDISAVLGILTPENRKK